MFLLGCNNKSGVVGGESNVESGPILIDAVLCLNIIDGQPARITEYFYYNDTVNVYTLWENVEDTGHVYFYFISPDGIVRDSSLLLLYPSRFSTCITSYIPKNIEGEWEVLIYLNDTFKRSMLFTLTSSTSN